MPIMTNLCCPTGCENTYWDAKKNPPRKGWREWKLTEGVCKGFMTAYASAAYRRGYLDDLVFEQVSCVKWAALPQLHRT
jgi:hypothetical protein